MFRHILVQKLRADRVPFVSLLVFRFGLSRLWGNIARTIERLKELVAEQAAELAFGTGPGRQFDAAIAGMAVGTANVGLIHFESMPRRPTAFQPRGGSHFFGQC